MGLAYYGARSMHYGSTSTCLWPTATNSHVLHAQMIDTWTSDPWELAYYNARDALREREHVPGVPLGCRVLWNLIAAVTARAGRAAASKLHVLLHLADDRVEQALLQLASFNHCGLMPTNIWIMVQVGVLSPHPVPL